MSLNHSRPHVAYVLVADFDIDTGSVLSHQYPCPTGTDEQTLAESMLPDGVHLTSEAWTVFFLNQTPDSQVVSYGEDEQSSGSPTREKRKDILHVLNLVRNKADQGVRRGAVVKAIAICTHLPYFQIFKPIMLIALDEYYKNPTEACVKEFYDTLNALDLSMVPQLTRHERLVMRLSDRTDIFSEKFSRRRSREIPGDLHVFDAGPELSTALNGSKEVVNQALSRSQSAASLKNHRRTTSTASGEQPSEASHDSSNGVIWTGDDSSRASNALSGLQSNGSFDALKSREDLLPVPSDSSHPAKSRIQQRDTHFYETTIKYANIPLPIKIPVSTFPEEVGDFSLTAFIKYLSSNSVTVQGPLHPQIHTSGRQTHPIIVIFNAIITQKRVMFVSKQKSAADVSNCVLASCAMVSGGGCYLRGFVERAYPYINLATYEKTCEKATNGFIAGSLNPLFAQKDSYWDVCCDLDLNVIKVRSDIPIPAPAPSLFPIPPTLSNPGKVIAQAEGIRSTQDEFGAMGSTNQLPQSQANKIDYAGRQDAYDAMFIEELLGAIANHVGESGIRARFAEYVYRFLQLASRYEEDTLRLTYVGYPCAQYTFNNRTGQSTLGSGIRFADEFTGLRELSLNAARIEGWRKSPSYEYWVQDFQKEQENNPIQGFDLEHQVVRLRNGKNVPEGEVALILETMCKSIKNYDQVVEMLVHCPPQQGGLQPIAMCLFHQQESIRNMAVDLLNVIRDYPVGFQFLQSLNQFFRYSYIRQANEQQQSWREPLPNSNSQKTPSNHSQVSLGAA
ncbi:hypothetical protein PIIN_01734 [Serendipita indica DSM 11827]|uniref:UDENN domain-containing protein n=1 Tax=Serendipita indica (strain DSM 11827) TaxID=1109443 RepID=G4U3C0_SERID|nr:hypothetical protein PIIN_01734 [Serendipita indica DSM 11827]